MFIIILRIYNSVQFWSFEAGYDNSHIYERGDGAKEVCERLSYSQMVYLKIIKGQKNKVFFRVEQSILLDFFFFFYKNVLLFIPNLYGDVMDQTNHRSTVYVQFTDAQKRHFWMLFSEHI